MDVSVVHRLMGDDGSHDTGNAIANDNSIVSNNDSHKMDLWFHKLMPFIEHFRTVSLSLVLTLAKGL